MLVLEYSYSLFMKHIFFPSGDCLTVGEWRKTDLWLLIERFKASLQILIECLPHDWMLRAREELDEMHVYVGNSVPFELDCEVVLYFADSALEILSVFNRDSSTNTARDFLGGLEFIIERGYYLQRLSWTNLEELIASEWPHPSDMILEELRREWGTESDMLSEDIYGIVDWVRRFDTECCASAQRMIEAWPKAVDLVNKSNHNGMTSMALIFTDDQVCPEPREQCQREIETYSRVFNNYGVVYKGNSVKARTQGVVDDPDRKAISSKINQDGTLLLHKR